MQGKRAKKSSMNGCREEILEIILYPPILKQKSLNNQSSVTIRGAYLLMTKGRATRTTPVTTRIDTFEKKYGTTNSPVPLNNGMMAFCFFPYTKNPSPMDPKITPHINVDAFIVNFSSHSFAETGVQKAAPSRIFPRPSRWRC